MRSTTFRAAAFAAILPAVSALVPVLPAFAHGGRYQGPAGEIPPESREPNDPPPPPEGPPTGTPPGEDPPPPPVTPGDPPPGPRTPGEPPGGRSGGPPTGGPPSGAGPAGGVNTGRRAPRGLGFDDWQFWWGQNQAEILAVRGRIAARSVFSAPGGASRRVAVTEVVVREEVVPLLRSLVADAKEDDDVRAAAVLALAKIGDGPSVSAICGIARSDARDGRLTAESSALALGLFERDDPEIRETLLDLVARRGKPTSFSRAFAAVALGLQPAGDAAAPAVREALLGVVAGDESGQDAKPAALLGLGARRDPAAVPALLAALRDGKVPVAGARDLSEIDLAHVAQALGRIGAAGTGGDDASVADALTAVVSRDQASPHVRRSAVVALGRLAPSCPPKALDRALDALVREADRGDDAQCRNLALVSLGRAGASPRLPEAARARCVEALGRALRSGRPANAVQPWAALGLGLVARGLAASSQTVDDDTFRRPIREHFEAAREASVKSAYAVASGLAGDGRAADALLAVVQDRSSDARLRGYAALALGMIGDPRAADPVRAMIAEEGNREMRLHASVASGLLGDARAVADLVASLRGPDASQFTLGSAAIALGAIGDERAVAPLCAIVRDSGTYPELTRALAVVALGRIGDRRAVPTLAALATDVNYRAQVPAIAELLSLL